MEIKITENQLNHINKIERLKKTIFKYWDKTGGKVDKSLISIFGGKNGMLWIDNKRLTLNDFYNWVYEWRGEEESKRLAEEFLNKNPHHIGDCGGYDFEFDVWEYNIDGNHIEITLLINDSRGTVVLMDDGGLMNLFDARTNDEFGWEVENEIQDCLSENLAVYLEEKLGYSFVFDNILYTSDGKR